MVAPGAGCHCCHRPAQGGSQGISHSTPQNVLGAPQGHRGTGKGHKELCGSPGTGRRTHSTFLRETFWLGRVAETVM